MPGVPGRPFPTSTKPSRGVTGACEQKKYLLQQSGLNRAGRISKVVEESVERVSNPSQSMRRVVELNHFLPQMKCKKCYSPLQYDCIVSEALHGLASRLKVQCKICGSVRGVTTCAKAISDPGKYAVNLKLPLGAYKNKMLHIYRKYSIKQH